MLSNHHDVYTLGISQFCQLYFNKVGGGNYKKKNIFPIRLEKDGGVLRTGHGSPATAETFSRTDQLSERTFEHMYNLAPQPGEC